MRSTKISNVILINNQYVQIIDDKKNKQNFDSVILKIKKKFSISKPQ